MVLLVIACLLFVVVVSKTLGCSQSWLFPSSPLPTYNTIGTRNDSHFWEIRLSLLLSFHRTLAVWHMKHPRSLLDRPREDAPAAARPLCPRLQRHRYFYSSSSFLFYFSTNMFAAARNLTSFACRAGVNHARVAPSLRRWV